MKKPLLSALIGAALASGVAVASSQFSITAPSNKVGIDQVKSLAYNGSALVALLGNPDVIKTISVGKTIVATTWTYKGRALDENGKATDVNLILGADGFAKSVTVNGNVYNVLVNGQDEFAGTEDISDIPA